MHVLHPSSDDARKKHNTPIPSFINQSINHSLARRSRTFSSSGAYVKSPVIADTASDVGNVLRTASRRQSPLGIEPRINESHRARITHHPSHRIASHPGMTCTTRARSPARPMVSANHRTARTLAGDASTPTIHARVDMSTTRSFSFFFSLFFPSPLGRRGVARWMSPVIARRRFISRTRRRVE